MRRQLAVLRDHRVWKYCQYYSIVFGGFTALSVWMPQYFKSEYGFSIAQASLLAACFSLPGGAFRAVGPVPCLDRMSFFILIEIWRASFPAHALLCRLVRRGGAQ